MKKTTTRFTKEAIEKSACAVLNKDVLNAVDNPVLRFHFFIGIDVGTNTGLAVWDAQHKNFISISSMLIHVAMDKVRMYIDGFTIDKVMIRVEDARQAKYGHKKEQAQGGGSVKRDSTIWDDFLNDLGAHYEMVRPRKEFTKFEDDKFKSLTGHQGRTNKHGRDAAMLVFGLSPNYIMTKR